MISKQFSYFITYELTPGIYTNKDILEAVYTMVDHEKTLQIEYDDITMKTKLILTRLGLTFGVLRFNEKSFFNTLLGVTQYWDYKPTNAIHADSPGVYTSQIFLKLTAIDKIHLKCDVVDASVVNGLKQPILYSFVLDKPPGCKLFCEPETIHYKKNKQICFEYYNILFERWKSWS